MMNSAAPKAPACLKWRLSQICEDLVDLTNCIPDGLNCTSSTERLVEQLSQGVASLQDLLKNCIDMSEGAIEEHSPNTIEDQNQNIKSDIMSHEAGQESDEDRGANVAFKEPTKHSLPLEKVERSEGLPVNRECVMSLDISEYELQMLEMQAREEEQEEQSILAFQEKAAQENSADLSNEAESDDDEFNCEMIQCAEEMEKMNESFEKQPDEPQNIIQDEDEDVVEDYEEHFDPSLPEPGPEQIRCLKMYFGHHSFKPVQWKVIQSVLQQRRDNLVVMATGYGKSLCFQFPPVYCVNISVVISPLIALMEDQVLQLRMSNIQACFLGSAQTQNVFADLRKGMFRVVYMTPEFCSVNISLLEELNVTIGLSLIAVDEAHCISHWGHDFRGAYRDLGKLKRRLPGVPIVALTATASPSIRNDIINSLHLVDPLVTCTTFDRPNLYLDVNRKSGDIIKDLKCFLVKKTGCNYEFEGAAIVYCPSKKEAERVTAALYKLGIRCGVYHAGLSIQQRKETQYQFMRDEIQCVVATVAFGMGINKPDIRKVIHYGAPKEMESYYQEIGRAGRDGLPSACHVLWMPSDMTLNKFLLNHTKSDRFRSYKLEMLAKMEKYLNSTKCRRKLILSHFEDKQLRKITSGILGTSKCCDNCKSGTMFNTGKDSSEQDLQDFGSCAFQLMGAVSTMGERFGITAPILLLRGSISQRVPQRFQKHPLFGAGRSVSDAWWRALSRELVAEKFLMETSGYNKFSTLCKLTPKGRTWLNKAQDERHRTLLLQPNRDLCARAYMPRNQDTRPSLARVEDTSPPGTAPRANLRSQADTNELVKKGVTPDFRSVPALSQAKPQPPPVSAREMELQAELYGRLVAERQKLAGIKDIPPAILATNKILLDMAKLRPCMLDQLKQVDGVSEAKATMLAPLLQTITEFCQMHSLQEGEATSSAAPCLVQPSSANSRRSSAVPLADSIAISYRLFQTEGKSMRQVADTRSLPVAVVESHLLQALKASHPLDTERAGLSSSVFNTVTHIISSSPFSSDLSDFKSIRALVPEEISTFLLRLSITKLQREGFPNPPPNPPTAQGNITWIEPQAKHFEVDRANSALTSGLQPEQPEPEPDSMDMSEDELFSQLPMPDDLGTNRFDACSKSAAVAPSTTASYTSGMKLASWNEDNLDKDTEDLFSDSPVKTLSQMPKRKLPDWAESQKGSVSATAAAKNPKKKKGLFI